MHSLLGQSHAHSSLTSIAQDKYFQSVCELDIMFNLEKTHFILDEMVMNGYVCEANRENVLRPVQLMDKVSADESSVFGK